MYSLIHNLIGDEGDDTVSLHDMGEGYAALSQLDDTGREHRVVISEAQLFAAWGVHSSRYGSEAAKNTDRGAAIAA